MSRQLPDWIDSYLEYTEETEPPYLFKLWTAISTVAAALQRKCVLNWGTEVYYPNLYVVLCGPAASRKGTAMRPGAMLLDELGITLASQASTRQALIKAIKSSKRNWINPATGAVLTHSSLTIFSDELTVFLGYKNLELLSDLCDWYDCGKGRGGKWTYETISREKEVIDGIWVNILGATTPSLLRESIPTTLIGSGLASRIIFVYEPHYGKKVIIPYGDPDLWSSLLNDLEHIHMMSGEFEVTDGFVDLYSKWYGNTDMMVFQNPILEAYCARRPTHLFKLSCIMSASRSSSMIITSRDFENALNILKITEQKMEQTFSGVGKSSTAEITDKILTYIAANREVPLSKIVSLFYRDADNDTILKVIRTLDAMGYAKLYWSNEAKGAYVKYIK